MFAPMEGGSAGRRGGSTRSNESSKWDYVKTFYTDQAKWDFVKSVAFFGVAVYLVRDLASNDLLPMD
ncbi:unnamed protein product [Adineta steineri]|uniref:Uncharacterized protein n=1 Tax=Adineta steineri TaxID=433720 RepID=A0A814NRW4_9BILA|nr:unnamed protein product [Adineta steineri]CAF1096591.1 unnamed protein product [Adineta steineri]CAF1488744.1 unnamed protein product [Adineta steineri]